MKHQTRESRIVRAISTRHYCEKNIGIAELKYQQDITILRNMIITDDMLNINSNWGRHIVNIKLWHYRQINFGSLTIFELLDIIALHKNTSLSTHIDWLMDSMKKHRADWLIDNKGVIDPNSVLFESNNLKIEFNAHLSMVTLTSRRDRRKSEKIYTALLDGATLGPLHNDLKEHYTDIEITEDNF